MIITVPKQVMFLYEQFLPVMLTLYHIVKYVDLSY